MSQLKLNKKHPLIIVLITLVLLFSLNLNVFAASADTVRVSNSFYFSYFDFVSSSNSYESISNVTQTYFSTVEPVFGRNYTKFSFPYLNTVSCGMSLDGIPYNLDSSYNNLTISFSVYAEYSGNSDGTFSIYGSYTVSDENGETFDSDYGLYSSEVTFNKWTPVSITIDTSEYHQLNFFTYISIDFNMQYDFLSKTLFYPTIYISDVMYSYDYIPPASLPATPIPTPDTGHIDSALNDFNSAEGELPQVNEDNLSELMNFDFSSITNSMSFVRDLFDDFLGVSNFSFVLVFALTIGLATYIIGRKVG